MEGREEQREKRRSAKAERPRERGKTQAEEQRVIYSVTKVSPTQINSKKELTFSVFDDRQYSNDGINHTVLALLPNPLLGTFINLGQETFENLPLQSIPTRFGDSLDERVDLLVRLCFVFLE